MSTEASPPATQTPEAPEELGIAAARRARRRRRNRWSLVNGGLAPTTVTMLVALALGALLNAEALVTSTEQRPFGPSRDRALAVWEPVRSASRAAGLDAPRQALDDLTGRGNDAAGLELVAPPSTTTTTTAPPIVATTESADPEAPEAAPITTATTTTTEPPHAVRRPTTDNPIRLWIGGDSLAETFGVAQQRVGVDMGIFETKLEFRVSSGFARPDFFDWPTFLANEAATFDPDVMVMLYGANDAQPMRLPDGSLVNFLDDGWLEEYERRIGGALDSLDAPHRLVFWVGVPVTGWGEEFNDWMLALDGVHRRVAGERDHVHYIESWRLFSDENGDYAHRLPAADGSVGGMRQRDELHFSTRGGVRLAWAVIEIMGRYIDLTAAAHGPGGDEVAPPEVRRAANPDHFDEPEPLVMESPS